MKRFGLAKATVTALCMMLAMVCSQVVMMPQAKAATVISSGHVDIGPFENQDGSWSLLARDDTRQPAVWRNTTDVVLKVSDKAKMAAPTDGAFARLGAQPGQQWWVIPQAQRAGVVWLGWNTQNPGVARALDRGMTMKLGPAKGPGRVLVFIQDGAFGAPLFLADSAAGGAQDVWVDANTHVHANWVFTQPGVYTMPVSFVGTTKQGQRRVVSSTVRFAVGDATSSAQTANAPVAAPVASSPAAPTSARGTTAHTGSGTGGQQSAADAFAGASTYGDDTATRSFGEEESHTPAPAAGAHPEESVAAQPAAFGDAQDSAPLSDIQVQAATPASQSSQALWWLVAVMAACAVGVSWFWYRSAVIARDRRQARSIAAKELSRG